VRRMLRRYGRRGSCRQSGPKGDVSIAAEPLFGRDYSSYTAKGLGIRCPVPRSPPAGQINSPFSIHVDVARSLIDPGRIRAVARASKLLAVLPRFRFYDGDDDQRGVREVVYR